MRRFRLISGPLFLLALTSPAAAAPILDLSTYLGGSSLDRVHAIAVDAAGNTYVTGETVSVDFPAEGPGPRGYDAFVSKLAPDGSLVYSVLLGGAGPDSGQAIAVDAQGHVFVAGFTRSADFPRVSALPPAFEGGEEDVFVAKLDPSGASLLYSTRLGGDARDEATAVAVDAAGNAYLAGATHSHDFPTVNALQTTFSSEFEEPDAFVAKLDPSGTRLLYSTYLGGGGRDQAEGIAVDSMGHALVAGSTQSYEQEIPPPGTAQTSRSSGRLAQIVLASHSYSVSDAFVAKLHPSGSSLVYFQRIGGGLSDIATGIAADAAGNAWVSGWTDAEDFPVRNALQPALHGPEDAFVLRLNPQGEILWSTYLGGSQEEAGLGIAVTAAGAGTVWVAGLTNSVDFPLRNPIQPDCAPALGPFGRCVTDAFVTALRPDGSGLLFSTFLGGAQAAPEFDPVDAATGIAVDRQGNAWVGGVTVSTDFPVADAAQPSYGGGNNDGFVARLAENRPPVCSAAFASPALLWPPNGRMVPVTLRGITDPDDDPVTVTVTRIAQDEPLSKKGQPDATWIGTPHPRLRADRAGSGDGRVYHLTFTATDPSGGSCTGTVTVCVPHDRGKRSTCGDGGPRVDSTRTH